VPGRATNEAYGASYTPGGEWPVVGHDGGRTGHGRSAVPTGDVDVAWRRRPGDDPHRTHGPIVGPDRVYTLFSEQSDDEQDPVVSLVGLDAATGDQQVQVSLQAGYPAGLALAGDRLVTLTRGPEYDSATLTVLDRQDLQRAWSVTIPDVTGPPAVVDDTCYLATRGDDHAVYAYALDGTRVWRTSVDGECYTAVCADESGVYVGLVDGRIAAFDRESGATRWASHIATPTPCCPDIQGMPTVADGRLYVPGMQGEVVAAAAADGTVLWRTIVVEDDHGNRVPSPAVAGETVFASTPHGGVLAIDATDGSTRRDLAADGDDRPLAVGDDAVVVPRHGSVSAVDTSGETQWTVDLTVPDVGNVGYSMDTEVALAHGMCYVAVADGRVYALGARRQD
jgi:outer membrane protein assembly factor BamB